MGFLTSASHLLIPFKKHGAVGAGAEYKVVTAVGHGGADGDGHHVRTFLEMTELAGGDVHAGTVTAADHQNIVPGDQFFHGGQPLVRLALAVPENKLDLHVEKTALGVNLVQGQKHAFFHFAGVKGQGTGKRPQDADLDGVPWPKPARTTKRPVPEKTINPKNNLLFIKCPPPRYLGISNQKYPAPGRPSGPSNRRLFRVQPENKQFIST